jgi:lysophospholipase L1-like esterase
MKKAILATCLVALLGTLPVSAQVDLTTYAALGDSLTAGFASGSLHQYYQERAYPVVLANQAGAAGFAIPAISPPGIPQIMELRALAPSPVLLPAEGEPGMPINATYPAPYNNLGIPGATLADMMLTVGDINNLLAGTTETPMFDLILRDGTYTAIEQAIGLNPTFVTAWIGNNDILGAAIAGTPLDGITMTPLDIFQGLYEQALGALATYTSADVVVFTIPSVTAIPFVTTLDPYLDTPIGRVPLIGSNGLLPEDAYVTLAASAYLAVGVGIPAELGGTGQPLPEDLDILSGTYGVVLRAEEVAIIDQRIAELNAIITGTAAAFGYSVLDVNAIFAEIVAGELPVFGTIELSADFLTGGLFSYDGVHPQSIGQGLIAMHLVDLINTELGGNIPKVDMYSIMMGAKGQVDQDVIFSEAAFENLKQAFPRLDKDREAISRGTRAAARRVR